METSSRQQRRSFKQSKTKRHQQRKRGRERLTSCGGTSKETVLRSALEYVSIQGMMKKIPGPLAPPVTKRPSLKITARSYSWTT